MKKDEWRELALETVFDYEAEPEVSPNGTYGIEIEFIGVFKDDVGASLNDNPTIDRPWEVKEERGVMSPDGRGGEVTSPILVGEFSDWVEVKGVCDDIIYIGGQVDSNCGGHIHYGYQILGEHPDNYHNLILLWAAFESVIKTFCAGENEEIRSGIFQYAPLISSKVSKNFDRARKFKTIEDTLDFYNLEHPVDRHALNFSKLVNRPRKDINGTIEVRLPNGTLNPVIWQNNILFFDALMSKATHLSKEELNIIKKILGGNMHFACDLDKFRILLDMISEDELLKLKWIKQFLLSGEDLAPNYQDFNIALAGISRSRV